KRGPGDGGECRETYPGKGDGEECEQHDLKCADLARCEDGEHLVEAEGGQPRRATENEEADEAGAQAGSIIRAAGMATQILVRHRQGRRRGHARGTTGGESSNHVRVQRYSQVSEARFPAAS